MGDVGRGLGMRAHTGQGALFADPPRQEGLRVIADPLVEQGCDLAADIGGVVQAREFKTLQGCDGRIVEEIPRRVRLRAGYGAPRSQLLIPHIPSDQRQRCVARRLWKSDPQVDFLGGD
jgi:hypothetical protein